MLMSRACWRITVAVASTINAGALSTDVEMTEPANENAKKQSKKKERAPQLGIR